MSIYRRGKSWYINLKLGGVRINRKAGDTKSQAKMVEAELKTKFRLKQLHITDIENDDISFEYVSIKYLSYVKDTKSKRTYELESGDYHKHLQPFFFKYLLHSINSDILLKYQSQKKAEGYGNRTVNIHIGLVRKIMNYAEQSGYISNIKLKYPMLPEPKKLHAFLTPDEFNKLIQNISYDMALKRVIVGRLTGMRPAELAYLTWNDVDFDLKTIKIQGKKGWRPKTDEERIIPLNKTAINILKELYRKTKSQWVFSNTDKPVKSIKKVLDTAAKKSGLNKRVTPNMLRHTYATHSLMFGADLRSVQEILGHKDLSTTNRYTHAIEERLRKTVEILD